MTTFRLEVAQQEHARDWQARWSIDGQPLGQTIDLSRVQVRSVAETSRQFLTLFEQERRPLLPPDTLRSIGRHLFAIFWEPLWEQLRERLVGTTHEFILVSRAPYDGDDFQRQLLNLPWEVIELENGWPIGCDPAWSVRRSPLPRDVQEASLAAGPLRVLFLAAAPREQAQLDFEREEEAILKATSRLPGEVVLRFADLGRFDELAELVIEVRPHIIHLSGHGRVLEDGRGTFAFEDERGATDARDADELAVEVLRSSPVRCVFLNGCQTSQAAMAGLCQSLVRTGLPIAIGWSASVADDLATEFATEFYKRVVRGTAVSAAVAHARRSIQALGRHRVGSTDMQDATFVLPQLYASTADYRLFDAKLPPEAYDGPRTEYFLLGDGIVGLREGFVGRRREQQQLLPALREGETTVAVLTGLGGAGKSTLATRVVNRLQADGFHPVPVKAKRFEGEAPAEVARRTLSDLIAGFETAFLELNRKDLHERLVDSQVALGTRLRSAVRALNDLRVLLVLDNFEDCLELETRVIADPDLARCYAWFTTDLTRGSRLIVTCRYLPEPSSVTPSTFRHFPLPDFEEATLQKFLRRDAVVERRLRQGKLTPDLLGALYRQVGGTPGFLTQVREVLGTIDLDDLAQELAGDITGELDQHRHAYFERIFVRRLFSTLSEAARALLGGLALSDLPLPLDALERVAASIPVCERIGKAAWRDDGLEQAVSYGLVQTFAEAERPDLFSSPGLLRGWLVEAAGLPVGIIRAIQGQLATFWRETIEANRQSALRVPLAAALAV